MRKDQKAENYLISKGDKYRGVDMFTSYNFSEPSILVVALLLTFSEAKAGGCAPGGSNTNCSSTTGVEEATGNWEVKSDVSALDDSKSVFVSLSSENQIPTVYTLSSGPAILLLRCQEGTTSVLFGFMDHFMADIQGYGRIDFRIDAAKGSRLSAEADTSNKFLGLWSGKRAIPFIKSLFGAKKLLIRATPFNEAPLEVTFNVTNTEPAVAELRKACRW